MRRQGNTLCRNWYSLKIYKNNGDGTYNPDEIEPEGSSYGISDGAVSWVDYDADGDLDLAVAVILNNPTARVFRIYKNLGGGSFDSTEVEPDTGWGVDSCSMAWGDFDNDGYPDAAISGDESGKLRFRVYRNKGNGSFDTPIEPETDWGMENCSIAWADYNNDGLLDVGIAGDQGSSQYRFKLFVNIGGGQFFPAEPGWGVNNGAIAWGIYDDDGDVDIAIAGNDGTRNNLRVYKSQQNEMVNSNVPPNPPSGLIAKYSYGATISTITFKWSPGNYDFARSSYSIYYQVMVSTVPTSLYQSDEYVYSPASFTFTWNFGSPMLGNYIRPPVKVWPGDSQPKHGFIYSTTTQILAPFTSYYYRVQTIDSVLERGDWSGEYCIFTSTAPPNSPQGLSQLTGAGISLVSLNWTDATVIYSSFSVSDPYGLRVRYYLQITSVTAGGIPEWSKGLFKNYISE